MSGPALIGISSGSDSITVTDVVDTVSVEMSPLSNNVGSDAFNRLRVSFPITLFDSHSVYGKEPLIWQELTAGSGSVSFVDGTSFVGLTVTTGSSDRVVRQSKSYIPYQPGKSHLLLFTGVLGTSQTYVVSRIGYFDNSNGVFFQMSGPTVNPSVLASDAFSGASLSGSWTTESPGGGSIGVNSGVAWSTGGLNTHGIAEYTGIMWPNDQYSEITYGIKGSLYETDIIGPAVRMDNSLGGYWGVFYGVYSMEINGIYGQFNQMELYIIRLLLLVVE